MEGCLVKLIFGQRNSLSFSNESEFYYCLGFLVNQRRTAIFWEHNEDNGAWGSEGRIICFNELNVFPRAFQEKFTLGTSISTRRINCNEYVSLLVEEYFFRQIITPGLTTVKIIAPAYSTIISSVPEQFRDSFNLGYTA